MLTVTIPAIELYDEYKNEFIIIDSTQLTLEHSLVSLSEWESKWEKPFLSKTALNEEETIDYIRCMTLNTDVPPEVYLAIPDTVIKQISDYITKPTTATWITETNNKKKSSSKVITAELIYFWMISFHIPVDFQNWHLNKLITLIRVCEAENNPPKNKSKKNILNEYAALNNARRQQLKTKG